MVTRGQAGEHAQALTDGSVVTRDDRVAVAAFDGARAFHNLLVTIAVLVMGSVLTLAGWFITRRRVSRPLIKLTTVTRPLADRDFVVEVPGSTHGDEWGAASGVVSVCRENGRNTVRLEAEASETHV